MNALTRWPNRGWSLLGDIDELNNRFNSSFYPVNRQGGSIEKSIVPAMDIIETNEGYEVRADLPGVIKEDLSVSVKDNVLTISADSTQENVSGEDDKVIKSERLVGKYLRSMKLGNAVDDSKISAKYSDGVLRVSLPKAEKSVSREIDVSVH